MRKAKLLAALLLLALLLTACSGAYSENRQSLGNTGHIVRTIQTEDGVTPTHVTIDEYLIEGTEVNVQATLTVGQGTYQVDFRDQFNHTLFTISAGPGETVQGSGVLPVDDEGQIDCLVTATGAQNVTLVIDYDY